MTGVLTITQIRKAALSIHTGNNIGMCRNLTDKLSKKLINDFELEKQAINIRQGYFRGENKLAEHFYITIDGEYIKDMDTKKLIIDPTIRQFTQENFYEGNADTYIKSSDLPKIGIFTPYDEIYNRYE